MAIDGDGIAVRPGRRLVNGVEAMAAILHPGAGPGHVGTRVWCRVVGEEPLDRGRTLHLTRLGQALAA